MEPLISIIICCYNMENYIDRCMESVVNQTIGTEQLELILVNDASTDGTLSKLKEWEARYPDSVLVVTYEENQRLGGARNIGMQYANAEYIGMVDADDWIEPDMFETLYTYAKKGDFDCVGCKNVRDNATGKVIINNAVRHDVEYHFEKKGEFYDYNISDVGNNGDFGGLWSCIYKKSIITDNDIYFPIKLKYEDNYWSNIFRLYVSSLYIVDKVLYHYYVNMNSIVTARNDIHQFDRLSTELGILEEYKQRGAFELFYDRLEWGFLERFYLNTMYIIFIRFDDIPLDVINYMRKTVLQNFPNYRNNPHIADCNRRQMSLLALLENKNDLTMDELILIKYRYLEDLVGEKNKQ